MKADVTTPSTAATTVPATGFLTSRATSPYALASWNAVATPSPVPITWSLAATAADGAHDLKSAKSLNLNPCSRPRRSSKKATSAAASSSDRTPAPIRYLRRPCAHGLARRSYPEASVTTSVRRSTPPVEPNASRAGRRTSWNAVMDGRSKAT